MATSPSGVRHVAFAIDRGEVPEAGVIRAEDDEPPRQLGHRVERRRDVAAVHQPRMRHDRADEPLLRLRLAVFGEAGTRPARPGARGSPS